MTHLMTHGGTLGRRGPQRDARASGKGRNAPGGPPCVTGGRVPLSARGVAARLWCAAPRREPRLTSGQGNPVKWVTIYDPWY
jgi:hypothetical protein